MPAIRSWLGEAGFVELAVTQVSFFGVGAARFTGTPRQLDTSAQLFTFVR